MLSRIALVASALFMAAACQTHAAEETQDRATLVAACKAEAVRGHLQGFLDERRAHHERMTVICEAWRKVSAADREALSQRCLAEARRGPSIGHRQRPMNQSHIFRLRELCRTLATT